MCIISEDGILHHGSDSEKGDRGRLYTVDIQHTISTFCMSNPQVYRESQWDKKK
jgi:hypothetical protein